MADMSQFSDEDLQAIANGDMSQLSDEALMSLSGDAPQPQQPIGPKGRNYADRPWSEVGQDFLRMAPKVTQDLAGGLYTAASNPMQTADVVQGAAQGLMTRGGEQLDRIYGGDPNAQVMNPRYQQFIQEQQGATPQDLGMADSMIGAYQDLLTEEGLKRRLSEESYLPLLDVLPVAQVGGKALGLAGKGFSAAANATPIGNISREMVGKLTGTGADLVKKLSSGAPEIAEARKLSGVETVRRVRDTVKGYSKQINEEFGAKLNALETDARVVKTSGIVDDFKLKLEEYKIKIGEDGKLDFGNSKIDLNTPAREAVERIYNKLSRTGEDLTLIDADTLRHAISNTYTEGSSRIANALISDAANSVKKSTVAVAPEYGEILQNISEARQLLDDFSANVGKMDKDSAHTILNKLKQSGRDGYEIRAHFLDEISNVTGTDINGLLAGYMTKNWLRPGAGSQMMAGAGLTAGVASVAGQAANIPILAGLFTTLAASSPRAVADTLRALGASKRVSKSFMKWLPKQKGVGKHGLIGTYRASQERQKQEGQYNNLIQQGVQ